MNVNPGAGIDGEGEGKKEIWGEIEFWRWIDGDVGYTLPCLLYFGWISMTLLTKCSVAVCKVRQYSVHNRCIYRY